MTETPIINGVQPPFLPIGGIEALSDKLAISPSADSKSFQSILQKEMRAVKFSAHAQERLKNRQIELNERDITSIENAVTRAEEKGSRDSLLLMNNLALVVSVKNRTVVTAMDSQSIREHVFTNIDSTVII
ncbi:MAG: flagellar protein [Ignavibacteria bacterium]|nr:flagellar protein [Ignavibacteria bacterium]